MNARTSEYECVQNDCRAPKNRNKDAILAWHNGIDAAQTNASLMVPRTYLNRSELGLLHGVSRVHRVQLTLQVRDELSLQPTKQTPNPAKKNTIKSRQQQLRTERIFTNDDHSTAAQTVWSNLPQRLNAPRQPTPPHKHLVSACSARTWLVVSIVSFVRCKESWFMRSRALVSSSSAAEAFWVASYCWFCRSCSWSCSAWIIWSIVPLDSIDCIRAFCKSLFNCVRAEYIPQQTTRQLIT